MEVYKCQIPAKAYCKILRQKLDSPFYLFDERMNGIIIGPFFSIAHHAAWEWNRKVTSECNRAWGYVREKDGVTEVRFIRGKGMFAPSWLIFYTLLCAFFIYNGIETIIPEMWYASIGISVVICLISAVQDSLTENGIAGAGEITRFLKDTEEYYC